jgi:hypothetical protein
MVQKQYKFVAVIVAVIILVLLFNSNSSKKETEMAGLKVHYYDAAGKEIFSAINKGFTIVTPPGGVEKDVVSMQFDIIGQNTGEVSFENVGVVDAYPEILKTTYLALPNTTLPAGTLSKLLWTSGRLYANQFESLPQPVTFWVKVGGKNTFSNTMQSSENSVTLIFGDVMQVTNLRFEKVSSSTLAQFTNSWLAYDGNNDGVLEAYGSGSSYYGSSVNCADPWDTEFIAKYGDWTIQKDVSFYPKNKLSICKNKYASGVPAGSDGVYFYPYETAALRARTNIFSVASYEFNNREIYKYVQENTCGNGAIESVEFCETSNLNGKTCSSLGVGYAGGTLACVGPSEPPMPSSCFAWNTASCTLGTSVRFRTYSLLYKTSGGAIAYTPTCGGDLIAYGKTTGACTDHYCDANDQTLNVPSLVGTTKMWYRDAANICICDEDDLGVHTYSMRYSSSDSDKSKVSISKTVTAPPSSIDAWTEYNMTKEVVC